MAGLMYPRVAHNYAAKGYYPTDDATLRGIGYLLAPTEQTVVFFDPTCGEGEALLALSEKSRYPHALRYGIELDIERAELASHNLTQSLQASTLEAQVTTQSVSCLFLNPPYGWALNDGSEKSERLEHQILHKTFPCLKAGGVIIAVLPKSAFNRTTQIWFLLRFDRVRLFEAATDRFQQIVIIGIKRSNSVGTVDKSFCMDVEARLNGELPFDPLPNTVLADDEQYTLPTPEREFRMTARNLDLEGLLMVKRDCHNLWHNFEQQFIYSTGSKTIRPLYQLTDWHTCLLITSGVVGGIVDNGKRRLLIKGKTMKVQQAKSLENDAGEEIATQYRDRFQTVITAIDLTHGSPIYGQVLKIH